MYDQLPELMLLIYWPTIALHLAMVIAGIGFLSFVFGEVKHG